MRALLTRIRNVTIYICNLYVLPIGSVVRIFIIRCGNGKSRNTDTVWAIHGIRAIRVGASEVRLYLAGADPGGGGEQPARAPPKIGKNMIFFFVKSWFFTRNTPKIFAPPSARHNFFKCAPLTWNPGSAPVWYNIMSIVFINEDTVKKYVHTRTFILIHYTPICVLYTYILATHVRICSINAYISE